MAVIYAAEQGGARFWQYQSFDMALRKDGLVPDPVAEVSRQGCLLPSFLKAIR